MADRFHFFDTQEWLGEFSYPDGSFSFPGKLKYSPEGGVQLEFLCEMKSKVGSTPYLIGTLESGKSCVLVGKFTPSSHGMTLGQVAIFRGTCSFPYCIFGTTESPAFLFDGVQVDFSHFQEFCYPQGFKSTAPWSNEPKILFSNDLVEFSLIQPAQFDFAGHAYANIFHSDNEQLLSEVRTFMSGLKEKYPNDYLYARKEIQWQLRIKNKSGATAKTLFDEVFQVARLLSLLLFYPVRPVEISFLQRDEEGKINALNALATIGDLDSKALKFFRREPHHHFMPINMNNVDVGSIFGKWWALSKAYDSFAPKIYSDFGSRSQYEVRSEVVLLLAQLEKINDEIAGSKSEKYDNPIKHYGNVELINLLKTALLLDISTQEVGPTLSDLRGEIAHFGRPVKLLNRLPIEHLVVVSRVMDIIVASHIYEQLGIDHDIVENFQRRQMIGLVRLISPQAIILPSENRQ